MKDIPYQLHYQKTGQGPPFLLIHGFASSAFTWRHIVDAFRDRYTVWTVDLLGHGQSPKPSCADYSIDQQADLIRQFIRSNQLQNLTIAGHSFGGGVTLRMAIDFVRDDPGIIQKIVLIGSAAFEQEFPPFIKILRRPILGRILPRMVPPRLCGRRAVHFACHDQTRITKDQIEGWASPMRAKGIHESLRKTALQILPANLDELVSRYPELDIPTLLIWGRHDPIVPLQVGEKLHSA